MCLHGSAQLSMYDAESANQSVTVEATQYRKRGRCTKCTASTGPEKLQAGFFFYYYLSCEIYTQRNSADELLASHRSARIKF